MDKIIAVSSGKGGVGKTNVSLNLAIALNRMGKKTVVMDADLGLANINILLGAQPKLTFYHLLYEGASLEEVMFEGTPGVMIIPGVSGIQELTKVDESIYAPLMYQFHELDRFDYMIVDTAAGIAPSNVAFSRAADAVLVVLTPEPTSMTDGFALIKILANNQYSGDIRVLPNMFDSKKAAEKSMRRIDEAGRKFLNRSIKWLPPILRDGTVEKAVVRQKPFMESAPGSVAGKCMSEVAAEVAAWNSGEDTLRAANFLSDVIRYANDQDLLEMVQKYSQTLEKRRKEKKAKEQPPSAPDREPPHADKAAPETTGGQAALPALVEAQKSLAEMFEKSIATQNRILETLVELVKSARAMAGPGDVGERGAAGGNGAERPGQAKAPVSRKLETMMLDLDEYVKSSRGGEGR
ncbi:MAG: MinD/ParA family protein [Candidatus Nitrospinota bacterium M3_3B_026]